MRKRHVLFEMKRRSFDMTTPSIDSLPNDSIKEIILNLFGDIDHLDVEEAGRLFRCRELSKRFVTLVDREILIRLSMFSDHHLMSKLRDSELSFFPGLKELNLTDSTHITGDALVQVTHLHTLSIIGNREIRPDQLRVLTNLKTLYFGRNHLMTINCLETLTGLEKLALRGDDLITDESLSNLHKLKCLDARYNRLLRGETFSSLTSLEELYINGTNISGKHFSSFSSTLRVLGIALCHDVSNEALACLTCLEELNIHDVTHIQNETLMSLTRLKGLTVSYNPSVTDRALSTLTNLTYLNIEYTKNITAAILPPLLRNIEVIKLPKFGGGIKWRDLVGAPKLKQVYINDMDFTVFGRGKIRSQLEKETGVAFVTD